MSNEAPRYRVTAADGCFLEGCLRRTGTELTFAGWPPKALEPLNASAKRIALYHARNQGVPGLPASPHHHKHGYYLPGLGLQYQPRRPCPMTNPKGTEIRGLVPEQNVDAGLPAMPEYEMLVDHRIGAHHILKAGERFKFIGWPRWPELFTATNHPAQLVEAYFAEHREHPDLESRGPWCWYRGLFLPELPKVAKQGVTMRSYPDGSYLPIDPHSEAVASEIERVTGRRPGQPGKVPQTFPASTSSGVNRAPLLTRQR